MKEKNKIIKNVVNLVILLLSTELIHIIINEIPEFGNIDLRLIFIFIVANYMGMTYGIFAALLSSVLFIVQSNTNLTDISIIFLNTNNWLQIVIYLAFSIVIGLKHDKDSRKQNSLNNQIEEYKEKEESNYQKIEAYEKELKEFNQELLTHEKTYLQVAELIKEVNNSKGDNSKITEILKVFLNNNSVELLHIEDIDKYINKTALNKLKKEGVWINKDLDDTKPAYIAPIFANNMELAIVVWKCSFEQMNNNYRNQLIGTAKILYFVLEH